MLCDIDSSAMHRAAGRKYQAKTFSDWQVLDEGKRRRRNRIDARPRPHLAGGDAVEARVLPAAHTVHEARQMKLAAEKYGA
jgi:hypothetical protein